MSITSKSRLIFTAAALFTSAAAADAKPRRVVVSNFDGPRDLADSGRASVVNYLGQQYDVVATKRWETARAEAAEHAHGPATWQQASRKAGVDAIVEGWVQKEGGRRILNLVVRDASSGNEIDTVQIKLGERGLTNEGEKELATDLDTLLEWIDGNASDGMNNLPVIKVDRLMVGAKKGDKKRATEDDVVLEDKDGNAKTDDHKPRHRRVADDADPKPDAKDDAKDDAKKSTDAQSPDAPAAKKVATGEEPGRPKNDLLEIFGPDSKELTVVDATAKHVPVPTPRFEVSAGGYFGTRSLEFNAEEPATEYPGTGSKGVSLHAAFYPFPTKKIDGRLSGIGLTFGLYHAIGSTVTSVEPDSTVDYTVDQNGWDAALHYRLPLDIVNLDFQAFYGQDNYIISGASADFDVPDTSYRFVGVGAAVELQVTDHTTIGFGAKYFDILETGDLSDVMWYGPGGTSGVSLNANFTIPLPQKMFVRGDLTYKRFTLEPDGSGDISDMNGVQSATDTTVNASVELGVSW